MGKSRLWYSPASVTRFRPAHIRFILENCELFAEGRYPPVPYVTGYTDYGTTIQTSSRPNAAFTHVVEIHAELFRRISRCKTDGDVLLLHYEDDTDIDVIAKALTRVLHTSIGEHGVWRKINRVIKYCAGEELRGCSYYHWKRAGKPFECSECRMLHACVYYHEPDKVESPG